ncbi:AraC family transcriptional regulator [Brucella sp. TWI432]
MLNSLENLVSFHNINSVDAIEITKTSSGNGWDNLHIFTVKVQPFSASFDAVDSLLVSMVLKGHARGTWNVDGLETETLLQPGAIIILPPDCGVAVDIKDPVEFINIYVSKKLFSDIIIEFSSAGSSLLRLDHSLCIFDELLEQTISSLKDLIHIGGRFSAIEVQYIARVIVARLVSKYSTNTTRELNTDVGLSVHVLQKTFNLIDQNLHRRIGIERLAEAAGIGAAQFARLFKRATSVTLHQYIIRRRVERAKELLIDTHMPIAEIAHDCGFADQVHLTRFFGRITGTSPASFRKKRRRS